MIISIHPRPYDIERARAERDYAKYFAVGWRQVEIRQGALFAEVLTSSVWSPAAMNGGRRCSEAFAGARLLALDFENPEYPLAQCINEWCDTIHWIGTTRNHQREKGGVTCDRFRLVVPWAETLLDPEVYRYNYEVIGERYGADMACNDVARLFFPCQRVVSINLEGEFQPVLTPPVEWLNRKKRWEQRAVSYAQARIVPWSIKQKLEIIIPIGKRDNTWYGFAKDLALYGFEPPQIVAMILSSATYRGGVMSQSLIKEIEDTTARGHKDGRQA